MFGWGIYFYGIGTLPPDVSPSKTQIPSLVSRTFWVSDAGATAMVMKPLSPWNWIWAFGGDGNAAFPPGSHIASYAARFLLQRNDAVAEPARDWNIRFYAATIWVSRHWSAEESVTTILENSYFGNGFYGIKQAAEGYFGLDVKNLGVSEAAILAALVRSPHLYDPWCHPDRARLLAERLMQQTIAGAQYSPRLLPAPAAACAGN